MPEDVPFSYSAAQKLAALNAARDATVVPTELNPFASGAGAVVPGYDPATVSQTPAEYDKLYTSNLERQAGADEQAVEPEKEKDPEGMVHYPNLAYDGGIPDTTVWEEDGVYYIIPRYSGMAPEDAIRTFGDTGEHLGGFWTEDAADQYAEQYLNPGANINPFYQGP